MPDYEPVDLRTLCNVGPTFWLEGHQPKSGLQEFYGLPFQYGSAAGADSCAIGCAGEEGTTKPVVIPIGRKCKWVVFSHALLETQIYENDQIGREVAAYVIQCADGREHRFAIRERFEVAAVPAGWGNLAFLALPDQKDGLMPRAEGPWEKAGNRQAEAVPGDVVSTYLCTWQNEGAGEITSITLHPTHRKFALAGITLGHLDEHPLRKVAKREVLINLPNPEDAEKQFGLEVDVDRGVATYPFALPALSAREFLEDPVKGWGESRNRRSSPAYVEIAARPSATITVRNDGQELARVNWGKLQAEGEVHAPRADLILVDRGKNWVHTRVLDGATGNPIPCRVHFRSPEGIPYQPHGYHNQVNRGIVNWHQDIGGDLQLGQASYAYIDGTCQGWLPRGEVIVDVARGFEYEPLRTKVQIKPGQRELELRLDRWTNMNQKRWFSGDSHVHFLGERGAHREAQGEDLNVVNLLASQWGHLFTNTEDFIGRPTASEDGKTIVYCSQENRQHMLGHLILWGLKEQVSPWCSDGPGEAELGGNLEVTMSHWADACHKQGGTVVIPHMPAPNGEPAALIATGRADAIEMLIQGAYMHEEYYRYLNCGYRLPLVGGTDKMSSDVPVGLYRTYAHIPDDQPFDYETWCAAVRAGRTFLSGGPMIGLSVEGGQVGDTLRLPGNGGTLEVEAWAESIFPLHTLQLIQAGKVVASTDEPAASAGKRRLTLKAKLKIDGHTWVAARCGGPGYEPVPHSDGSERGMFAHTSPIYVAVGGDWWMFDRETAEYMLTLVDGSVQYIRHTAAHHEQDHDITHHHDHHDHQAFLEEPFHEAAAAIHKRMHQLGIPH